MLNIHFGNYYVPSRDYARELPFNHLDSNASDKIPLASLVTIAISQF